ncbi:MAG TPA: glycine cleavage system aminomethyltransferase GcvT [Steroidobacteraceae bacterium]|nr:glycine cleavage system aminomethyltransferase GcvT [Steroidobacteraceae bacterium]
MGRRTALYDLHRSLGARMVDFGGWDMPLQYGSQLAEHHAVRGAAGVFDVSHMGVVDLHGPRVRPFLERLLANDVGRLRAPGKLLYTCMLNEGGGVVDDLLVGFETDASFRLIVNAGTRDKDLAWIRARAGDFEVAVAERADLAILAVQGPEARARTAALLTPADATGALELSPFCGRQFGDWFVSRTGYTGEDGFELVLPAAEAERVFQALIAARVVPCGLGARDTLRLEAGMNLYGNDMDETTHPFESGLGWTVTMQPQSRRFIGRDALEAIERRGAVRELVGLLLEDRGVLRRHQSVIAPGAGAGEITSGGFSPTLERSIAFARLPAGAGAQVQVDVRGRLLRARVVPTKFVRHGQSLLSQPQPGDSKP